MATELYLLRHGETEWTISGQHTGITEIPLTARGEEEARQSGTTLQSIGLTRVFTSPRVRAQKTCELAGLQYLSQTLDDLHEWLYGSYEGLLPKEIQRRHPGWNVFQHGCPEGETPEQVSERADRVLNLIHQQQGKVAVISHGHFSRALAMRWIQLPISHGAVLESSTASISILGFSKNSGKPLIKLWNQIPFKH